MSCSCVPGYERCLTCRRHGLPGPFGGPDPRAGAAAPAGWRFVSDHRGRRWVLDGPTSDVIVRPPGAGYEGVGLEMVGANGPVAFELTPAQWRALCRLPVLPDDGPDGA